MGKIYVKAEVEYRFDVPDGTDVAAWFKKLELAAAAGFTVRHEHAAIDDFWLSDTNDCRRCDAMHSNEEVYCDECLELRRAMFERAKRVAIVEVK